MSLIQKILIFSGFLLIIFGAHLLFIRNSSQKLEFKNPPISTVENKDINPVKLSIPNLKIENQIYSAQITKGNWETTQKGISFLSTSPVPGTRGNSIFYGHNFTNILGNLYKIKPGDKIELVMSNGEKRVFYVAYTSIVNPTDISILAQTNDKRITIYTCYGFLDSKRFVATAILKNSNTNSPKL